MTANQNGIKAYLDADETTPFRMSGWTVVKRAARNFDSTVYQTVVNSLIGGETGLKKLVDALATVRQTYTPCTLLDPLRDTIKKLNLANPAENGLAAVKCATFLALACRAGTLLRFDESNYSYHVGYKPGGPDSDVAVDVKSGRSFGASPAHNPLDASDLFFLAELLFFLDWSVTKDPSDFYRTVFQAITRCDTSGWKALSPLGQGLATDFLAVYTAELDRNLMTGLKAAAWEDDLAEVTLLSAYGVRAGMVFKNGKLVAGTPADYYGQGPSGGSGLGEKQQRDDRHALQSKVCQIEKSLHAQTYENLANLIPITPQSGAQNGERDLIHQVMVFLNDPTQQSIVYANAPKLTDAMVQFLLDIRTDAAEITDQLTNATQTA